jgi:hypothetical protein
LERKPSDGADWQARFLESLARTANVRLAAQEAGVDYSTAYNWRRRDVAFAASWARAVSEGEAAAGGGDGAACAPASNSALTVWGTGGARPKVTRVKAGRWSPAAERSFLAVLADTCNVTMAARMTGFSTTAVYNRRLNDETFRVRWDAALDAGCARLELLLVERATRALDPDSLPAPSEEKVSISDALAILRQARGGTGAGGAQGRGRGAGQVVRKPPQNPEELRAGIMAKFERVRARQEREQLAEGWTKADDGTMVPPGWVRAGEG